MYVSHSAVGHQDVFRHDLGGKETGLSGVALTALYRAAVLSFLRKAFMRTDEHSETARPLPKSWSLDEWLRLLSGFPVPALG